MERVRVVLVSPGDVMKERVAARTVIDELNRGVAEAFNCHMSLWRWETDARPGMHLDGPQGLIDELMDIRDADVVVGVFWKRFGTPTGDADSGTEHELRRAWVAWTEQRYPEVMVYFCTRPYAPTTTDELAQWQRVVQFRDDLPAQQLWWPYEGVAQFTALVREHLTRFLLKRTPRMPSSLPGSRSAEPTVASQQDRTEYKLRQLQEWKHLLHPEVVLEAQQKLLDSWMKR